MDEELLLELDALEERAWYAAEAFRKAVADDPIGAVGHLAGALESVLAMAVKAHLPEGEWPRRPTLRDYVELAHGAGWLDEQIVQRIGVLTDARNSTQHPERWARETARPTDASRAVRSCTFQDLYSTMADACTQLYNALPSPDARGNEDTGPGSPSDLGTAITVAARTHRAA